MGDGLANDHRSVPDEADFKRALAHQRAGRYAQAIGDYTGLLAHAPGHAPAWNNLGSALRSVGAVGAAIGCYKRALEIDPACSAIGNLGNALKDAGRIEDALAAHRRAVAAFPDDAAVRHNYGIALRQAGDLEAALDQFDAALRLAPDAVAPSWDRALALLQLGRLEEGWRAYECRFRLTGYPAHQPPVPRWMGESFRDRTLLVYPEQGLGDCIFASRFLPAVKRRGGVVVLECRPELLRLFSRLEGVDRFVAPEEAPSADLQCPMMSLPGVVGATPDGLPPPRLRVPAAARERVRTLIDPYRDRFTVGIVWSGNESFAGNRDRSVPLDRFLRLAEVPNVQLFSLQKGPRRADIAALRCAGTLVIDAAALFRDFADTAALVQRLDLVIMTDSAVAHLAGSLGVPVWNLLTPVPYWLYGLAGGQTPWYPAMRLFRQGRWGDWNGVFADVEAALVDAVAAKRAGCSPASPSGESGADRADISGTIP